MSLRGTIDALLCLLESQLCRLRRRRRLLEPLTCFMCERRVTGGDGGGECLAPILHVHEGFAERSDVHFEGCVCSSGRLCTV